MVELKTGTRFRKLLVILLTVAVLLSLRGSIYRLLPSPYNCDKMLQNLANELEQGDTTAARRHFLPGSKVMSLLDRDHKEGLLFLAKGYRSAKFSENLEGGKTKMYKIYLEVPGGTNVSELLIYLTPFGWIIDQ